MIPAKQHSLFHFTQDSFLAILVHYSLQEWGKIFNELNLTPLIKNKLPLIYRHLATSN